MNHLRKYFPEISTESGATLIVIIVAMVIVAVLGAGLFTLTMTSSLNQAEAQKAAKAFYLAESGVRVASSEFKSVPQMIGIPPIIDNSAARDNKLISLQGLVISITNQGQFEIEVFPDWVWARTAVPAGISMPLYFPGRVRSDLTFPTGGILKLKGKTTVAFFNSAPVVGSFSAPNGTPIIFTFAAAYPYTFQPGDEGYIGYAYNSPQTVNAGGNLVLNYDGGKAAIFPPQNGTIYVEHIATYPQPPNGSGLSYRAFSQFTYDNRIPSVINPSSPPATVTLQNIQAVPVSDTYTPAVFPLKILYNASFLNDTTGTSRIYLGKTLAIQSTSTYGN